MDRAIAEQRIVGTVLVIGHEGETIYRRTAGWLDREARIAMREEAERLAGRADESGGLPQDLNSRSHSGAVEARAASARAGRGRPRRPPEQSDRRLAVQAGDGDDLVQQCPFLGSRGGQVPLSLHRRVLPQARSCHGLLPRLGVGNRDFGCTTSCSVTEILM